MFEELILLFKLFNFTFFDHFDGFILFHVNPEIEVAENADVVRLLLLTVPKEILKLLQARIIDIFGILNPLFVFLLAAFEVTVDEQEVCVTHLEM